MKNLDKDWTVKLVSLNIFLMFEYMWFVFSTFFSLIFIEKIYKSIALVLTWKSIIKETYEKYMKFDSKRGYDWLLW